MIQFVLHEKYPIASLLILIKRLPELLLLLLVMASWHEGILYSQLDRNTNKWQTCLAETAGLLGRNKTPEIGPQLLKGKKKGSVVQVK